MEQQIIDLILNYSYKNMEIDETFINNVINAAIKHYSLSNYINNIYILKYNSMGSYWLEDKTIIFDVNKIKSSIYSFEKVLKLNGSKNFRYLETVHYILHEIEHAIQQKNIFELDNIESNILREEFKPVYLKNTKPLLKKIYINIKLKKKYRKYYFYSPSERLSEINSLIIVNKLAKELQDKVSEDVSLYFLVNNLLRGYNYGLINIFSDTPTKYYLDHINPNNNYNKIVSNIKQISNFDRTKLGLECDKEHLNKLAQKQLKLKHSLEKQ